MFQRIIRKIRSTERPIRSGVSMRIRALFLTSLLVVAVGLPLSALGQDNQKDNHNQTPPAATQTTSDQQGQPPSLQQPQTSSPPAQPSTDQSQSQAKEQKIKHDGGKDDVDAIGNRKIGGMDWYS